MIVLICFHKVYAMIMIAFVILGIEWNQERFLNLSLKIINKKQSP